jgi:hypothetical protein
VFGWPAVAAACVSPPAEPSAEAAPLRFGIYPGGPAGSVGAKAAPRPEDPVARLAAVKRLAGANPFVVRLYSGWTGVRGADELGSWLDEQIAGYTREELAVELVVRYKPAGSVAASAPAAFARFVRGVVRRYGGDPGFVSLQVTNEANLTGAPEAADGAFDGAVRAVVRGVLAAKAQARRDGVAQLRVGFSWAHDGRARAGRRFWAELGRLGGSSFAAAVDWVGLDSYPGTWGPRLPPGPIAPRAAGTVKRSVRRLRECLMPLAGLGRGTAVHIAENGFPTGPGRSGREQARVLAAMVRAVHSVRAAHGVTDYRWFDLRDSASADASLESRYGMTRDDYAPKPAFGTYRDLIARLGSPPQWPALTARTSLSP